MARKCDKCPALINSGRTLCNKCAGVTAKAFERAPTKTRGATIDGKWESGRERSRKAGIADILEMLK